MPVLGPAAPPNRQRFTNMLNHSDTLDQCADDPAEDVGILAPWWEAIKNGRHPGVPPAKSTVRQRGTNRTMS